MKNINIAFACLALLATSLQILGQQPAQSCVEGTICSARKPPRMVATKGMCIDGSCKTPGEACTVFTLAADRPTPGTYAWIDNKLVCQPTAT